MGLSEAQFLSDHREIPPEPPALIEAATDDLDAATVARARLSAPAEEDLSLEDVAMALGFDLGELRAEVDAGTAPAHYATS